MQFGSKTPFISFANSNFSRGSIILFSYSIKLSATGEARNRSNTRRLRNESWDRTNQFAKVNQSPLDTLWQSRKRARKEDHWSNQQSASKEEPNRGSPKYRLRNWGSIQSADFHFRHSPNPSHRIAPCRPRDWRVECNCLRGRLRCYRSLIAAALWGADEETENSKKNQKFESLSQYFTMHCMRKSFISFNFGKSSFFSQD
jgi:hypothetical protein